MWSATSYNPPYIHFECGCGRKFSLEDLYFCFTCTKIVCKYCMTEEIDSFFCRNCMENMPSTEAKAFRNRCFRCFQCPICFTTLQIISEQVRSGKLYHFSCQHCFWDSVSIGIQGGTLDSLLMCNQTYLLENNQHKQIFQGLLDKYKAASRTRRKTVARRVIREPWSLEDLERNLANKEEIKPAGFNYSDSESLETFLKTSFEYDGVSTLLQRHSNLGTQSELTKDLRAQPLDLLTKRSKRCKHCSKYVVKPETLPTGTSSFKMENLLVYFLPRIWIRRSNDTEVLLKIINPTSSESKVSIGFDSFSTGLIHIDSYDQVMDLITSEGQTQDEKFLVERDKNSIVVILPRPPFSPYTFEMKWQFFRGPELKEVVVPVHIALP